MHENDFNIGQVNDSNSFVKAISLEMDSRLATVEEESIKEYEVWDPVELPDYFKPSGCKWVHKAKKGF